MGSNLLEKIEEIERAVAIDPEYFTAWERKFIGDMAALHEMGISMLQLKTIDTLYEKTRRR